MPVFISEEEKLPSQCQPRPFYGQPRQLPCSRHFVTMPTHLPPISRFFLAQELPSKRIVSQKHIPSVVKQHTHLVCGRAHQNMGCVLWPSNRAQWLCQQGGEKGGEAKETKKRQQQRGEGYLMPLRQLGLTARCDIESEIRQQSRCIIQVYVSCCEICL